MKTFFSFLVALMSLTMFSCSKHEVKASPDPVAGYLAKYDQAYQASIADEAKFEPAYLTEEQFRELVEYHKAHGEVWDENILRMVLPVGTPHEADEAQAQWRYDYLLTTAQTSRNDDSGTTIETLITRSGKHKALTDCDINVLAKVYANMGMNVGEAVSYDYVRFPGNLGRITNSDLVAAHSAYFYAANSNSIEYVEGSFDYEFQVSGFDQSWLVGADLVWNMPSTEFQYFDTQSQSTQVTTVNTGDTLHYGMNSPFGSLILRASPQNETGESPGNWTDVMLLGPFPAGITSISLYGGQLNQPDLW